MHFTPIFALLAPGVTHVRSTVYTPGRVRPPLGGEHQAGVACSFRSILAARTHALKPRFAAPAHVGQVLIAANGPQLPHELLPDLLTPALLHEVGLDPGEVGIQQLQTAPIRRDAAQDGLSEHHLGSKRLEHDADPSCVERPLEPGTRFDAPQP